MANMATATASSYYPSPIAASASSNGNQFLPSTRRWRLNHSSSSAASGSIISKSNAGNNKSNNSNSSSDYYATLWNDDNHDHDIEEEDNGKKVGRRRTKHKQNHRERVAGAIPICHPKLNTLLVSKKTKSLWSYSKPQHLQQQRQQQQSPLPESSTSCDSSATTSLVGTEEIVQKCNKLWIEQSRVNEELSMDNKVNSSATVPESLWTLPPTCFFPWRDDLDVGDEDDDEEEEDTRQLVYMANYYSSSQNGNGRLHCDPQNQKLKNRTSNRSTNRSTNVKIPLLRSPHSHQWRRRNPAPTVNVRKDVRPPLCGSEKDKDEDENQFPVFARPLNSDSFETLETQPEEASENSVSTAETDESDLTSKKHKIASTTADFSSTTARSQQLKVQWIDQVKNGQELANVHLVDRTVEATCRIVILLLMDHHQQEKYPPNNIGGEGGAVANNFEFLHCEFQTDDRLRVSSALEQITEIVLGTPQSPKIDVSSAAETSSLLSSPSPLVATETPTSKRRDSSSRKNIEKRQRPDSFRPFNRLCFNGQELVNIFALQDYLLEDGQSILVAMREESVDNKDVLLKQSALLLADKRLRRGIRKARIAGRSLQTLYGADGLLDLHNEKERSRNDNARYDFHDNESHDSSHGDTVTSEDTDDEEIKDGNGRWSAFDNLSLTSFDDDEFGDSSFESAMSSLSSNWVDDDFFDGKEFFLDHADVSSSQFPNKHHSLQLPASLCAGGLGWTSLEFDDDNDESMFPQVDVIFDVDISRSSDKGVEPTSLHGGACCRKRHVAVDV